MDQTNACDLLIIAGGGEVMLQPSTPKGSTALHVLGLEPHEGWAVILKEEDAVTALRGLEGIELNTITFA